MLFSSPTSMGIYPASTFTMAFQTLGLCQAVLSLVRSFTPCRRLPLRSNPLVKRDRLPAAPYLQRYDFTIFMSIDYSTQWKSLKIRRATFLLVWIGWLGVAPLLTSGIEFVTKSPNYGILSLFIYAPFFILAGFRLFNFKCPRCGYRYSGNNWMTGSKKCSNCGLPKWSNE